MSISGPAGWWLDFLLPPGCVVCRAWLPRSRRAGAGPPELVCGSCRSRLRAASWPRCPRCHHPTGTGRAAGEDCLECRDWPSVLTRARYAFVLTPPATDLVHGLKYEGWRELAVPMGRAMASALDRAFFDDDGPDRQKSIVVPVPTTGRRSRQRGYNQARLLAAEVARRVGSSCSDALTRVRAAASQTELAPWARRENVRGVFTCSEEGARTVSGMDVVLVDDVLTTGATAGEAAGELGKAGARTVTLLAFARALPRVVLRDAA